MASYEKEFDKWQSKAGDDACFIWLDGSNTSLTLLLNGSDEFTIRILSSPQKYEFKSSVKGLSSWVDKVNASIKAHTPASFTDLLSTAASIYQNQTSTPDDGDEDIADADDDEAEAEADDDDDGDVDDDAANRTLSPSNDEYLGEDFDLESDNFKEGLEVLRKRKRWAQKEAELRTVAAKEEEKRKNEEQQDYQQRHKGKHNHKGKAPATPSNKVAQIFSSSAATGVLVNDLLNIMQEVQQLGFSADTVDDNIYHWRVKMFNFLPDSSIARHLVEINKTYGYNYIELGVELTMDLYPFYPPLVKVIRPRLTGFMMGRVTSMELLKLSYWDPVKGMKYVLTEIRNLLQEHGKLDVNNPMNDLKQYPEGAYSRLEYLLLRLELLSEVEPRANLKYAVTEKLVKQPQPNASKPRKEEPSPTDPNSAKYWARGTGYGHGHTGKVDWDVQAYLAAQKQKDKETQAIIDAIATELDPTKRSTGAPAVQVDVIEESCLIPVLESYFRNDSLLDMGRHASLYMSLLTVVRAIALQENLLPLLDCLPSQAKSVHALLGDLDTQARLFLRRVTKAEDAENAEINSFVENVVAVYAIVQQGVDRMAADIHNLTNSMMRRPGQHHETNAAEAADLEKKYMRCLKPLQFDLVNIDIKTHHYQGTVSKGSVASREKVLRLAQEQSSLATSLPLNFSSSVFVRVDDQNMDIMRVLITGPDDTPYSGGCFIFDVCFPATYPSSPPLVNLQTTGNGSVRFNPNLYNCGKVCLSLLGTWSGSESESWNKDTSTFLQVLVSIQSLILVPHPFFNEPGYESQIGTDRGDANSRTYNETIRVATVEHAMLGQLRFPPEHFADSIRTHFALKKEQINKTLESWLNDTQTSKGYQSKLLKLVKELRAEFEKLEVPR